LNVEKLKQKDIFLKSFLKKNLLHWANNPYILKPKADDYGAAFLDILPRTEN